jgi:hypothetical protein
MEPSFICHAGESAKKFTKSLMPLNRTNLAWDYSLTSKEWFDAKPEDALRVFVSSLDVSWLGRSFC